MTCESSRISFAFSSENMGTLARACHVESYNLSDNVDDLSEHSRENKSCIPRVNAFNVGDENPLEGYYAPSSVALHGACEALFCLFHAVLNKCSLIVHIVNKVNIYLNLTDAL